MGLRSVKSGMLDATASWTSMASPPLPQFRRKVRLLTWICLALWLVISAAPVLSAHSDLHLGPWPVGFWVAAQVLNARRRLKKHTAYVVRGRQDPGTTFDKSRVVQGIHPVERLRLEAAKPRLQDAVRQGLILGGAKRVLVTFGTVEREQFWLC